MSSECEWVSTVTGIQVNDLTHLQSGVILCALMDILEPGSVPQSVIKNAASKPKLPPFTQRENIALFLGAASMYGVPDHELFETEDLYDARDFAVVTRALRSLSRLAHQKDSNIPVNGPKLAEKQAPREFSGERYAGWSEQQYGPMKGMMDGAARLREAMKDREELNNETVGTVEESRAPKIPPKPAQLRKKKAI